MLTGRTPYMGQVALEVLNAHIHKVIPRAKKYEPGVPDDVEALVLRMMAKEAVDRFADYESLEKSLAEMLERRQVHEESSDRIAPSSSWFQKLRHGLSLQIAQATYSFRILRFRLTRKMRLILFVIFSALIISVAYLPYRGQGNDRGWPKTREEARQIIAGEKPGPPNTAFLVGFRL